MQLHRREAVWAGTNFRSGLARSSLDFRHSRPSHLDKPRDVIIRGCSQEYLEDRTRALLDESYRPGIGLTGERLFQCASSTASADQQTATARLKAARLRTECRLAASA